MERLLQMAKKIAPSRSTVLIGENRRWQGVLARYIHENSNRSEGPFIAVNCAALPENLLESELFGHEKGSFYRSSEQEKRQV
jgi:two-component system response regulator FlrC